MAADLNQKDPIPPPDTYAVNRTESRTYIGVSRVINILDTSISTPSYNTTLTYIYDKASGMLLESTTQTTTQGNPQPVTTTITYSVIETNIFGLIAPSPTIPEIPIQSLTLTIFIALTAFAIFTLAKKRKTDKFKVRVAS